MTYREFLQAVVEIEDVTLSEKASALLADLDRSLEKRRAKKNDKYEQLVPVLLSALEEKPLTAKEASDILDSTVPLASAVLNYAVVQGLVSRSDFVQGRNKSVYQYALIEEEA